MFNASYDRGPRGPALSGWLAVFAFAAAVAVPTAIRVALGGVVTGCEFTPYLPFVLLSAVLLRWWQAAGVTLACVAIMGLMSLREEHAMTSCFQWAAVVFLACSAGTIGIVEMLRRAIASHQPRKANASRASDIVFSLRDDEVWASWYGSEQRVFLGTQNKVEAMMSDFLAQGELGRYLCGRQGGDSNPTGK